jgi:DNA-binding NarL/FixJ family response regulator
MSSGKFVNIRIGLVEDQRLIRELLAAVLSREADFEVVAQAGTGQEAIEVARAASLDVFVVDISLPDLDGVEVARLLLKRRPGPRVLALSVHEEPYFVRQMLDAGADGYVVKSGAVEELVRAIRSVHEGRMYLSPTIARQALGKPSPGAPAVLTPRERQVLKLIADGQHSDEIAARLSISAGTVEAHRRNIMAKLGMHTVAELTKYAIREGLTGLTP